MVSWPIHEYPNRKQNAKLISSIYFPIHSNSARQADAAKDSEPEILLPGIRKIAVGDKYINPALVDAMISDANDRGSMPHGESLSEQEFRVLKVIAAGCALGNIANLHLSPKTINTHEMFLMQ